MSELDLHWCSCDYTGSPLFHDNYEGNLTNCVDKHHYHCGSCLGLQQIG